MKYQHFFLLLSLMLFFSCEEREVTIPDFVPPESDRVVLLEEMTGVRCPGCPLGALEINNLQGVFGDNLVVVSYYTDFLGFPLPESKYDFRNDGARIMESILGLYTAKPASSFNRKMQDDVSRFNTVSGQWLGQVENELTGFSQIVMTGSNSYEDDKASMNISFVPKDALEGSFSLTVLITESHIQDAQLHPGNEVVEDYEHNHVFRSLVTQPEGQSLPSTLEAGVEYSYDFSFDLDEEWNPEHIEIVAFVERQENGSPLEVIQAFKMYLMQ